MSDVRMEHDSMGEVSVPAGALYGAQTQRAIDNFQIAGRALPAEFIHAIAAIKRAAALVNAELGVLPPPVAQAIATAADAVCAGHHAEQFPVDVYQTGSGTSTNMNVNEVLAHLAAAQAHCAVHPNDHVNAGQSSNDVIPTALQLSALQQWRQQLDPALATLARALGERADELRDVVKTGRTHLMDAMPIRMGQELSGWRQQIVNARERLRGSASSLAELPLGGTAVGTGVNADPRFAARVIESLAAQTTLPLQPCRNRFERMSSLDSVLEFSGQLRVLAVALIKICNDLRWMNSGPYSGLGEIQLAALQPGSSIMPGKINPVIPEACAMAATQCIGLDAAIAAAAQSGNFQLNVMLPLVADNLLQMIALLARASHALAGHGGIADFTVARIALAAKAERNPVLVTALAPEIGYELAAEIARRALAEQRSIFDVAAEMSGIDGARLQQLLNPLHLTGGE